MKKPHVLIDCVNHADDRVIGLLLESRLLMESLFPETVKGNISSFNSTSNEARTFLATSDDKPAGCAVLLLHENYGEIKKLFVSSGSRRNGIATDIIKAIEAMAISDGRKILRLESGSKLLEAHRLYERNGFKRRSAFGNHLDCEQSIFFEKLL
jgi:putative acetyltransferase